MKRICLVEVEEQVSLQCVNHHKPIFAKRDGVLCGFVVKEENGWIVRTGGTGGATGTHHTLEECLKSCLKYGYEFYIN
jgi:hypothetical protein